MKTREPGIAFKVGKCLGKISEEIDKLYYLYY